MRATHVGPDAHLTELLATLDASATPPPLRTADFYPYTNTRTGRANIYGKIVWRSPRGEAPARGLQVFIMDADAYTAWFAAVSTASALANKDAVASLDHGARIAMTKTTADRNGIFEFYSKAPGNYVLFAVLHETIGLASPTEVVQRGWDGNGHGADVVVPSIEIPRSRIASFRYLYAYRLQSGQGPWNLGIVRPSTMWLDGRPVVPRSATSESASAESPPPSSPLPVNSP